MGKAANNMQKRLGIFLDRLEELVRRLSLEQDMRLSEFVINSYPYNAQAAPLDLSAKWERLPPVVMEIMSCST
jgi:hypothetical protein